MANIKLLKDSHSFYISNLIGAGEQIQYDWSLSKSYTVIIGTGVASIGTDVTPVATRTAVGLYRVPAGEKLICSSSGQSVISLALFSLSDDTMMQELFPTGTTLTQLRASSSHLTSFDFENATYKFGETLTYNESPGNAIITLSNLNTKTLEALAAS